MGTKKVIASTVVFWVIFSCFFSISYAGNDVSGEQKKEMKGDLDRIQENMPDEAGTQVGSGTKLGSGPTNNASGTGMMNSEKGQTRASEARNKASKTAANVDASMNRYTNKVGTKSKIEQKSKYKILAGNINGFLEKIDKSDISESKKLEYRNMFEYIRVLLEDKIAVLETSE